MVIFILQYNQQNFAILTIHSFVTVQRETKNEEYATTWNLNLYWEAGKTSREILFLMLYHEKNKSDYKRKCLNIICTSLIVGLMGV